MTKKEILVRWLDEPRVRYGSESNMVLGYGDGWEWVKETLNPASTKNATFLKALDFSLGEVRAYLKRKSIKENVTDEDRTLYGMGYREGVRDALASLEKRFKKHNQ